jgi:hypothetical protein
MTVLLWVIMMAACLGSLFILIRSPQESRLALFRPTGFGGRLLVSSMSLSAFVFLIWQFAAWYNPSYGISGFPPSIGINGSPPITVWVVIYSLFICARAAYLRWLGPNTRDR